MNSGYVQVIIIKDKEVLCENTNNKIYSFLRGDIKEGEKEESAIKRVLKEQLDLDCDITFMINQHQYNNLTTFLVDMEDNKDISYKSIDGYEWVPLLDVGNYNKSLINQLSLLAEECVHREYRPSWYNTLATVALFNQEHDYSNMFIKKRNKESNEKIDYSISNKEKAATICIVLILGLFFNLFYTGKYIGISNLIYNVMLIAFFFWSLRDKIKMKKTIGWFLIIPTLLLSASYAIYDNEILRGLNVIVLPLLMVVTSMLIMHENIRWDNINFIGIVSKRIFTCSFENIFKPFKFIGNMIFTKNKSYISATKKHIVNGILISLPLLLVIISLLTSADMMFKYYMSNIPNFFSGVNTSQFIRSLIIVLISSVYIFGYVWSYKYPMDSEQRNNGRKTTWNGITVITVISVINIVYLIFTLIQSSYLYGAVSSRLPNGFTYAEYARKGFFELVAVTIINFTILLCSMRFMNREDKKIKTISNILFTCLVIFTFNMLFSAHYKMNLYVDAFGLTRLRIYVHLFLLLLTILLIIAFVGIWYKRIPINKFIIITSLLMYVAVNYINVDRIIAKENIERYRKKNKIDVHYLTQLSDDALPEIIKLKNDPNSETSAEIKLYLEKEKRENKDFSWYEFNYSNHRAKKLLD